MRLHPPPTRPQRPNSPADTALNLFHLFDKDQIKFVDAIFEGGKIVSLIVSTKDPKDAA